MLLYGFCSMYVPAMNKLKIKFKKMKKLIFYIVGFERIYRQNARIIMLAIIDKRLVANVATDTHADTSSFFIPFQTLSRVFSWVVIAKKVTNQSLTTIDFYFMYYNQLVFVKCTMT